MTKTRRAMVSVVCVSGLLATVSGEDKGPDGEKILSGVDSVLYAYEDAKMRMRFVLEDKDGSTKVRALNAMEKGTEYRLMRFTSPADQEGIAFLSLPDDVMYLYLPAFGKARRIAGHVKNKGFAGTDFTYENLEPREYAKLWKAEVAEETDTTWMLRLLPREGTETAYSKLEVRVRKANNYPVYVKYFDRAGKPAKELFREKIEKLDGYWIARKTLMKDLRTGHQTTMIIEEMKFDTGIAPERFSKRELERG